MKCVICRQGDTSPGYVLLTLQRGETIVVLKEVPAKICGNCGEYFLSEEVTLRALERAEAAVANSAEVEIVRFSA